MKYFPFALLALVFSGLMSSCEEDDDDLPKGPAYLSENKIVIAGIVDVPPDVTFDRIKVDIKGVKWKVIASIEAPYEQGEIVLTLPAGISPDDLQQVEQTKGNLGGYWPATLSDPDALVASLGDFFAYNGDVKAGRVYLTDWPGKGSSASKAFIYYHYADRPFTVSGQNLNLYGSKSFKPSYTYSLQFETGWNVYARVNSATPGDGLSAYTTTLPDETQLQWRFESYP
jgi:hypothetical protein